MLNRYHIYHGKKRTTVSLDHVLSEVMAIKLGKTPATAEAHTAVRKWLQKRLDDIDDPCRVRVSQWLQGEAVLFVTDKEISRKHDDWIAEKLERFRNPETT